MQNTWQPPSGGGLNGGGATLSPLTNSATKNLEVNNHHNYQPGEISGAPYLPSAIAERATSAPPPSGIGFDFGGEKLLADLEDSVKPWHKSSIFDSSYSPSDRSSIGNKTGNKISLESTIALRSKGTLFGGNISSSIHINSDANGFDKSSGNFTASLGTESTGLDTGYHRNAISNGSLISRPQSAAPRFNVGGISSSSASAGEAQLPLSFSRPPPGLSDMGRSPGSHSNAKTNNSRNIVNTNSLDNFDIMQAGSRRCASTGVIGQELPIRSSSSTSSIMESLGLIPPSSHHSVVMDLIKEDVPKSPSPQFNFSGKTSGIVDNENLGMKKGTGMEEQISRKISDVTLGSDINSNSHRGDRSRSTENVGAAQPQNSHHLESTITQAPSSQDTGFGNVGKSDGYNFSSKHHHHQQQQQQQFYPRVISDGNFKSNKLERESVQTAAQEPFQVQMTKGNEHNPSQTISFVPQGNFQQEKIVYGGPLQAERGQVNMGHQNGHSGHVDQHEHFHHNPSSSHIVHHNQSQSSYDPQTIYFSTQHQPGSASNSMNIMHGSGHVQPPPQHQIIHHTTVPGPPGAPPHSISGTSPHTIFVNPTPYSGYTTVQYHPGPLPPNAHHHVGAATHSVNPHQTSQGHHPPHEYVVHHSTPVPHSPPLTGTYVYYGGAPSARQGVAPQNMLEMNQVSGSIPNLGMTTVAVPLPPQTIPITGSNHGFSPSPTSIERNGGGVNQNRRNGKMIPNNNANGRNHNETKSLAIKGKRSNNSNGATIGGRRSGNGTMNSGSNGVGNPLDVSKSSSMGSDGSLTLLEEFRMAKNRSWTTNDIKGHIVEFCQDQNGSRFIQQRLEVADDAEKMLVMAEVLPSVRRLRNDVFGNYVVQKLLEHGTKSMQIELKKSLEGEVYTLSMQIYGCRVVQKALECLEDSELPSILDEFRGHVVSCIHDQNGNHVIQKCIEVMSNKSKIAQEAGDVKPAAEFRDHIQFIIDCALETVAPLSCHPYGCRVLQRILEHSIDPQKSRALNIILKCHKVLLDDQYGNYVIQHVLQFGRNSDRDSILKIIQESGLLALSRQKFASNVVEKLLKFGSPFHRNAIVREMLKVVHGKGSSNEDGKGCSVALLMVRDAYANYVVQTTLDVVPEGEEKRLLLEELNRNSAQLRNFTFAKHIVAKLGV